MAKLNDMTFNVGIQTQSKENQGRKRGKGMNKDKDAQFLCKDCARYNLCEYYHKRKEDSYICKYFHLSETYGMTNGEVIQALFPKAEVYVQEWKDFKSIVVWFENAQVSQDFTWEWWNAPYQKGGECE